MPYKNKAQRKAYAKKYYAKNKLRLSEQSKSNYEKNRELKIKKVRDYQEENKEKIKLRKMEYYKNNKEHIKQKSKLGREQRPQVMENWRKRNRKHINSYNRKQKNKRRLKNPVYHALLKLRSRFNDAMSKYTKTGKIMTSKKYGIDFEKIIEHLKPFPKDPSVYHIDHIRPLSSFNLNNPDEIRVAFAPENHQWLTAKENLIKGAKWN